MSPASRGTLDAFLRRRLDSSEGREVLAWVEGALEVAPTLRYGRVTRALAAVRLGVPPEEAASDLEWREFEGFCAALFKAKGFDVLENVTTTRPRVQVDLLARSSSITLIVDCKHWRRAMGASSLSRVVASQARRVDLLRTKMEGLEPTVVVILSMADEQARYVDGAAVVPVFALADFLENLAGYTQGLPRH